jgi:hypothetical protein
MDTSSMNDPTGRAPGAYQEQRQPTTNARDIHVHHPGREADVAAAAGGGGGGAAAAPEGARGPATNLPGSERAVTADCAAGGDDVAPAAAAGGGTDGGVRTNPVTGLPMMEGARAPAGASSARFGEQRAPGDARERGATARQTEHSTGMDPGGNASG